MRRGDEWRQGCLGSSHLRCEPQRIHRSSPRSARHHPAVRQRPGKDCFKSQESLQSFPPYFLFRFYPRFSVCKALVSPRIFKSDSTPPLHSNIIACHAMRSRYMDHCHQIGSSEHMQPYLVSGVFRSLGSRRTVDTSSSHSCGLHHAGNLAPLAHPTA